LKSYEGSQNFEIGSRDPGHAHLGVVLWSAHSGTGPPFQGSAIPGVRHSHGPGFGVRDRVRVRVGLGLGGPWEWRTPGMADRNPHSRGPSSMSVPNLKRISLFVQKL